MLQVPIEERIPISKHSRHKIIPIGTMIKQCIKGVYDQINDELLNRQQWRSIRRRIYAFEERYKRIYEKL